MIFDHYPGLYFKLNDILESDDKDRLVDLLQDLPTDHYHRNGLNSLVNGCVEMGASKCLIALVRGEVWNMHPTFDAAKLPDSGVTPLAYIAHSCPEDSQAIDLMLTKCGGTCLANVYCTIGPMHGLPIHFLLINLSVMEHLHFWYQGASLTKLVILLCTWETKPILDSLRVLVEYTDSINGIAWTVLKNGGLKQFAALLLIAREKVIASFNTGLTIHDYIKRELDSISNDKRSIEQVEYKCILMDARTLLTLFELTGGDLSSYCSSMQKYVSVDDVVDDIMGLLVKNQVGSFSSYDFDLTDCFSDPKEYLNRALLESSPWHYLDYTPKFRLTVARPPYYFTTPSLPGAWRKYPWATPLPIPKCLHGRLYTTSACQARKMSKSLTHASVSPVPMPRHLGYIATKLINRVRFL